VGRSAVAPTRRTVLTGNTLFIGDAGRPDLLGSVGRTAAEMAGLLYDSLRDKLQCPCGGRRRVLAMVFDPVSIERVLRHLGLPHERPARAPPRMVQGALGFYK
jgi:hypothetical protein